MNPIFAAALDLQAFCDQRGWRSCFIGGLAVLRWGEPRMTRDADLLLLTGVGNEDAFIEPLLAAFEGRRPDARKFALCHRVLLARHFGGTPLDIALGSTPFEKQGIRRSSLWDIGGQSLRTCSAEDLIIDKTFAGRDQDWLDIRGVIIRQGRRLDLDLIDQELPALLELKQAQENLTTLHRLICKLL